MSKSKKAVLFTLGGAVLGGIVGAVFGEDIKKGYKGAKEGFGKIMSKGNGNEEKEADKDIIKEVADVAAETEGVKVTEF